MTRTDAYNMLIRDMKMKEKDARWLLDVADTQKDYLDPEYRHQTRKGVVCIKRTKKGYSVKVMQ